MLTIRNQIKVYHWQTKSFSRHKATDDLTSKLDELIDEFVETYMGKYGRPKVSGSIHISNFTEAGARSFVAQKRKYLEVDLPKKIKSTDTDLLNVRDEILGELNKVLYLFTLQ
jgi:glutaredoxin 2